MRYLITIFTIFLCVLFFYDNDPVEKQSKETILKEIEEQIKHLDDVKTILTREDADLLTELKDKFNLESIRKDMAELKNLQDELKVLKNSAVKPHKDENSDHVALLADFTIIPENNSTSKSNEDGIVSESDNGPTGNLVKKEVKSGPDKYKKGHIPDLSIRIMKCSLTQLINKYDLEMVVSDYDDNYYLFDPVSKSFSTLTEEVINRFSHRGYRQYNTDEEKMWKLRTESYLGSKIKNIGWAYPKSAEQQLILKQLSYCNTINKDPNEIDITYGYYDSHGELVLTDWK